MSQSDQFADDDGPTEVYSRTETPVSSPEASPPAREKRTTALDAAADGLWDANDVARFLKVSRSWVYHRAEGGRLPCIRVGGLLRFDPGTIRASARGEAAPVRRIVAFASKTKL